MSKLSKTGKDIGFKLLESADTISDYIKIKNIHGLTDKDIRDKINDELYKIYMSNLSELTPIEQLFHLRNQEKKYMLLYIYNNNPDSKHIIQSIKIGTKDEILDKLRSITYDDLNDWDNIPIPIDQMIDDVMNYYESYFDNRNYHGNLDSIRDFVDNILDVRDNLAAWLIIDLPSDKICIL